MNHNEQESLPATELHAKISELLHSNPDIAEAVRSVDICHSIVIIIIIIIIVLLLLLLLLNTFKNTP